MNNKNVLLIGYGSIGKRHYRLLKLNKSVGSIKIVSRSSIHQSKVASQLSELSKKELSEYDIFIICSETIRHESDLRFIDENVIDKTIIVEKPLFANYIDFEPKNKVLVAYNLRFSPVIKKLKELLLGQTVISCIIEAGQYLPTWRPDTNYKVSYSADINQGGGALRDLSHELDYALFLFGKVDILYANSTSSSHLNIHSDDITTIFATASNCAHLFISMDYLSFKPQRRIKIQTDELTIIADLISNKIENYSENNEQSFVYEVERDSTYNDMHNDVLLHDGSRVTTYQEGLQTTKTFNFITETYWKNNDQ